MKIQMIDRLFGRIKVVSEAQKRIRPNGKSAAYWNCRCQCGVEKEIAGAHLRNGKIVSCGCHKNELAAKRASDRNFLHGMSSHRVHHVWWSMLQRCHNPSSRAWKWYGGNGIKVCEKWQEFSGFLADMGMPENGMTLDRINGKSGYHKENCRWASMKTQQRNRANNHIVTIDGESKPLSQWEEETGIKACTIAYREKTGKSGMKLLAPTH